MFTLDPQIDRAALRETFAARGRIRIAPFLTEDAALTLRDGLKARTDWAQVVNSGSKVFDLDRATRARMSAEQLSELDDAIFAGARAGFQHRYETIRVPDDAAARAASSDPLAAFASSLSGGPARDLLRDVTGFAYDFADAQGTAFAPGDFLTAHDDDVAGKGRYAAYVYGLTPNWRADYGGMLLFHGADGDIQEGFLPRFNTLNVFTVPQVHSVSMVTRAAPARRYSVTGWLRRAE